MILYDGSTAIQAGSVNATFQLPFLAPGSHSLTAQYNGDGNLNPSTSSAVIVTIGKASTTTALMSASNPSVYGQSVTFTATVSVTSPGSGATTGSVTFSEGSTTLGTGSLNGAAQATYSTSSLAVGSHLIIATYAGDGNFTASTSSSLIQVVNQAGSATALVSSQNPSAIGQSVTFTATITAVAPGAGTPTGTVTFQEGTSTLATGTLDSAGHASFTTGALSAGGHAITATYGGDLNFTGSSGTVAQAVNQGLTNTTTTVEASPNPSLLGDSVTFTATVTPAPPAGELVTFSDGSTTLGAGALNSGIATFTTTTTLSLGSHFINAVYAGDATLLASTGTLTQQISRIFITPTVAPSLSTVTVRGAGWPASEALIRVYLGPVDGDGFLCSVNADASGAFSQSCTVSVTLAQGTYLATATDSIITDTGNAVTVNPAISGLSPTYANSTNTVTISGSGFAANSNFTVSLGGVMVTPSLSTTNTLGFFSNVTFNVPSGTAAGATTITVTDSASPPNSASIAFTVYNATIAISPTTAASGSSVTVSGTGWPPLEGGIYVSLGPLLGYGPLCTVVTDAGGAFSVSCTVNIGLEHGTYAATASDGSITTTGNQVTVNAALISLTPTYANPMNTVGLQGGGFAANSNVTVTLGGVMVTQSTTSPQGIVALSFVVPSGTAAGPTTITVTDSASPPNSASIAFTVYNPTIAISPTSAASNSPVNVSGSGWPASAVDR